MGHHSRRSRRSRRSEIAYIARLAPGVHAPTVPAAPGTLGCMASDPSSDTDVGNRTSRIFQSRIRISLSSVRFMRHQMPISRGGRLGIHAPQDFKAPGQARIDLMGYAWFEGGWRLYDVSNPFRPEEVAWIVPPMGTRRGTEAGFIEWDRKIIYVFTDTGVYILSTPVLGEPVLGPLKPERWNPEGLNAGAP